MTTFVGGFDLESDKLGYESMKKAMFFANYWHFDDNKFILKPVIKGYYWDQAITELKIMIELANQIEIEITGEIVIIDTNDLRKILYLRSYYDGEKSILSLSYAKFDLL